MTFKIARIVFTVFILGVALADDLSLQRELAAMKLADAREHVESVAGLSTDVRASDIVALTNAERTRMSDVPLRADDTLTAIAQRKAELYARENYFDHPESDGTMYTERFMEAGYVYSLAGENLVVVSLKNATAEKMVDAWIKSEGHHANMIKPEYRDIGVGVAIGLRGGVPAVWAVQEFGVRQ